MGLIGFEKQRTFLAHALKQGTLAHACLFSGPEMIGKRLVALELAAEASASNRTPDTDPDIRILALGGEAANIPIEDIRDLKFFLSLTPLAGKRRIVIVDDAHRMTQEASNAFLKILEEPPSHALIVLVSCQPERLPRTVISRCLQIRFGPHSDAVTAQFLKPYGLSKEDSELAVALAGGRIGWIARMIEGDTFKQLKKDIESFTAAARHDIAERLQFAQKVAERDDHIELADLWLRWVRAYGTNPDKSRRVLQLLLELRATLAEPQFNARLALEKFWLSF